MADPAAATGSGQPRPDGWPTDALLVVTAVPDEPPHALAMPFLDATIIAVDDLADVTVTGHFNIIYLRSRSFDLAGLDAATRWALPALRPGGRMIVDLGTEDSDPPTAGARMPAFAGLRWEGLHVVNGRPCAVVGPGHPAPDAPVGMGLVTARSALLLARRPDGMSPRVTLDRAAARRLLESRRRSEQALLARLETLAVEVERLRGARRPLGWRLARRSRAAHVVVGLLRLPWRLAERAARALRGHVRQPAGPRTAGAAPVTE